MDSPPEGLCQTSIAAMSGHGTSRTWLIWRGCPLLNEKQTLFSLDLRLAASGAKRSLKIAGEARVAHELLTDNLFDLAGAQRG
jgi:hypothetical protein